MTGKDKTTQKKLVELKKEIQIIIDAFDKKIDEIPTREAKIKYIKDIQIAQARADIIFNLQVPIQEEPKSKTDFKTYAELRLKELEEQKPEPIEKIKSITQGQQILLLEKLGILDNLRRKKGFRTLTKEKQAELISLIIRRDPKSTKDFFTYTKKSIDKVNIDPDKKKYIYNTSKNNDFIDSKLIRFGII